MQRLLVERPLDGAGEEAKLPAAAAHQISTVLRLRAGDRVALFNDGGPEWRAVLTRVGRAEAAARLETLLPARPRPARVVRLCQALLKGEKMEWVLQKGTELGVSVFQPVLSERVVARKDAVPDRWRRIVIEATEQCGAVAVPEVREPVGIAEAVGTTGRRIICWEDEREVHFLDAVRAVPDGPLSVFVGPEGGFTRREVGEARDAGAITAALGHQILRAETAAVAASALALLTP